MRGRRIAMKPAPAAPAGNAARLREVPLGALHLSPFNVRQSFDPEEVKLLAASIRAKGVLQNLVARPEPGPEGAADSPGIGVLCGGRRWRACMLNVELGHFTLDYAVPVRVEAFSDREAFELSLVENDQREQLKIWEQADAYARLREMGMDEESIAVAVSRRVHFVRQRIFLHYRLAPGVRRALEAGQLTLGQAEAFTVGDHERQDALVGNVVRFPADYRPERIRAVFTEGLVPLSRAKFDAALYRGARRRDLFGEEEYAEDRGEFARLQRDAAAALQRELAATWSWAELQIGGQVRTWEYGRHAAPEEGGAIVHLSDALEVAVHTGLKKPAPAAAAAAAPYREPRFVPAPPGRGTSAAKMLDGSPRAAGAAAEPTSVDAAVDAAVDASVDAAVDAAEPLFPAEHLLWARGMRTRRLQLAIAARPDIALSLAILGLLECDEAGICGVATAGNKTGYHREIDRKIMVLLAPVDAAMVRDRPDHVFRALITFADDKRLALFAALAARQFACAPEGDNRHASLGDSPLAVAVAEEAREIVPLVWHLNADYLERLSLPMLRRVAQQAGIAAVLDEVLGGAPTREAAIDALALADGDPAFRPPELRIASAAECAAALGAGRG